MERAPEAGLGRALRSSRPNSALIHYLAASFNRQAARWRGGRRRSPEGEGEASLSKEEEKTGIFSAWLEKRWHRD
jgi:hypothetical protein